jgi:hypothetical protein
METYRRVHDLLLSEPRLEVPPGFTGSVMRTWTRSRRAQQLFWTSIAAAAVLILVLGGYAFDFLPEPPLPEISFLGDSGEKDEGVGPSLLLEGYEGFASSAGAYQDITDEAGGVVDRLMASLTEIRIFEEEEAENGGTG